MRMGRPERPVEWVATASTAQNASKTELKIETMEYIMKVRNDISISAPLEQ
jgi:uncharacterized membrane protein